MNSILSKHGIRLEADEPEIDETSPEFSKLREVVSTFEKSDKFFRKFTSYTLKHILENYLKYETKGEINHIGNGELIRAMELGGIEWKATSPRSRNAFLKFSPRSLEPFENYINSYFNVRPKTKTEKLLPHGKGIESV